MTPWSSNMTWQILCFLDDADLKRLGRLSKAYNAICCHGAAKDKIRLRPHLDLSNSLYTRDRHFINYTGSAAYPMCLLSAAKRIRIARRFERDPRRPRSKTIRVDDVLNSCRKNVERLSLCLPAVPKSRVCFRKLTTLELDFTRPPPDTFALKAPKLKCVMGKRCSLQHLRLIDCDPELIILDDDLEETERFAMDPCCSAPKSSAFSGRDNFDDYEMRLGLSKDAEIENLLMGLVDEAVYGTTDHRRRLSAGFPLREGVPPCNSRMWWRLADYLGGLDLLAYETFAVLQETLPPNEDEWRDNYWTTAMIRRVYPVLEAMWRLFEPVVPKAWLLKSKQTFEITAVGMGVGGCVRCPTPSEAVTFAYCCAAVPILLVPDVQPDNHCRENGALTTLSRAAEVYRSVPPHDQAEEIQKILRTSTVRAATAEREAHHAASSTPDTGDGNGIDERSSSPIVMSFESWLDLYMSQATRSCPICPAGGKWVMMMSAEEDTADVMKVLLAFGISTVIVCSCANEQSVTYWNDVAKELQLTHLLRIQVIFQSMPFLHPSYLRALVWLSMWSYESGIGREKEKSKSPYGSKAASQMSISQFRYFMKIHQTIQANIDPAILPHLLVGEIGWRVRPYFADATRLCSLIRSRFRHPWRDTFSHAPFDPPKVLLGEQMDCWRDPWENELIPCEWEHGPVCSALPLWRPLDWLTVDHGERPARPEVRPMTNLLT